MSDKLNPGEPLKKIAKSYNRVIDKRDELNRRGTPASDNRDPNIIKVKNGTGGDLKRGRVLQTGAYLLDATNRFDDRHVWFNGAAPADPASERYCILKRPIPNGEIGEAYAAGVCTAWVNVTSTTHTRAIPAASNTVLQSSTFGPIEILSPLSSTGAQNVIVRLHAPPLTRYIGKVGVGICIGRTGSSTTPTTAAAGVVLYDFNSSNQLASISVTVAARNPTALPVLAGEYVVVERSANGVWFIVGLLSAVRDFEIQGLASSWTPVVGNRIPFTVSLAAGSGHQWSGTATGALPAWVNTTSGYIQILRPGHYRYVCQINVSNSATATVDAEFGADFIAFTPQLDGSTINTAPNGYLDWLFPPASLTHSHGYDNNGVPGVTDPDSTAFIAPGAAPKTLTLVGTVKVTSANQVFDIKCSQYVSTIGHVIGDCQVPEATILFRPAGVGDGRDGWTP